MKLLQASMYIYLVIKSSNSPISGWVSANQLLNKNSGNMVLIYQVSGHMILRLVMISCFSDKQRMRVSGGTVHHPLKRRLKNHFGHRPQACTWSTAGLYPLHPWCSCNCHPLHVSTRQFTFCFCQSYAVSPIPISCLCSTDAHACVF